MLIPTLPACSGTRRPIKPNRVVGIHLCGQNISPNHPANPLERAAAPLACRRRYRFGSRPQPKYPSRRSCRQPRVPDTATPTGDPVRPALDPPGQDPRGQVPPDRRLRRHQRVRQAPPPGSAGSRRRSRRQARTSPCTRPSTCRKGTAEVVAAVAVAAAHRRSRKIRTAPVPLLPPKRAPRAPPREVVPPPSWQSPCRRTHLHGVDSLPCTTGPGARFGGITDAGARSGSWAQAV